MGPRAGGGPARQPGGYRRPRWPGPRGPQPILVLWYLLSSSGARSSRRPNCRGAFPGRPARAGSRSTPRTAGWNCPSTWPPRRHCRPRSRNGRCAPWPEGWPTACSPSPPPSTGPSSATVRPRRIGSPPSSPMPPRRRRPSDVRRGPAARPGSAAWPRSAGVRRSSGCAAPAASDRRAHRHGPSGARGMNPPVDYHHLSAGCSAAWLARLLWEQEAAGSNPASPTGCRRTASSGVGLRDTGRSGGVAASLGQFHHRRRHHAGRRPRPLPAATLTLFR